MAKIIALVASLYVCVLYVQCHTVDNSININEHLPFFNVSNLDVDFANYNIPQCATEVNMCMKNLHTQALACVTKLRAQPKAAQCIATNDDFKREHDNYKQLSFKWHKSMEQCLKGETCQGEHCLVQQGPIPAAASKRAFVNKRDAPTAPSEIEQFKLETKQCFEAVEGAKVDCRQKASLCVAFAHCYGEGALPTEARSVTWHKTIQHLRKETSDSGKLAMKKMISCMEEPAAAAST